MIYRGLNKRIQARKVALPMKNLIAPQLQVLLKLVQHVGAQEN